MRSWIAAAVATACLVVSVPLFASTPEKAADGQSAARLIKQAAAAKPGAQGSTCRWAGDNECDEPRIGTGACAKGTDVLDCRFLKGGETDSCRWARDGECDEPGFGGGQCVQGSDRTDCGPVAHLRFQTDSCSTAFNGVCDEPGRGTGRCALRSDRSDCLGRERPRTINDHFFGRDDRILVDTSERPWRSMGRLVMDTGETCTATLIGPDVAVTAAHCVHGDDGPDARGRFVPSGDALDGPSTARVVAFLIDPGFRYRRFLESDEIDGLDWALIRLDRRVGDARGWLSVRDVIRPGAKSERDVELRQAGYSHDTGERLSGVLSCRVLDAMSGNVFSHDCDTTRGDSGSAFVVRDGEGWAVAGVDSNFRRNAEGPPSYIGVASAAFAGRVAEFQAGRSGAPVSAPSRSRVVRK